MTHTHRRTLRRRQTPGRLPAPLSERLSPNVAPAHTVARAVVTHCQAHSRHVDDQLIIYMIHACRAHKLIKHNPPIAAVRLMIARTAPDVLASLPEGVTPIDLDTM